jgi:hypothetical protein
VLPTVRSQNQKAVVDYLLRNIGPDELTIDSYARFLTESTFPVLFVYFLDFPIEIEAAAAIIKWGFRLFKKFRLPPYLRLYGKPGCGMLGIQA